MRYEGIKVKISHKLHATSYKLHESATRVAAMWHVACSIYAMKKTFVMALAVFCFACNDSATVSQPNDLDHTKNNDTNPRVQVDSSKKARQGTDSTDSSTTRR